MSIHDDTEQDNTIVTVIAPPRSGPDTNDACLVMISGRDLGKKYALSSQTTLIGRSPRNDIHLDEEAVSRNHALIINEGERVIIRDLGSTNGTYVNDVQVSETALRGGDQIKIGRTIWKFLVGNDIEHAYHEEIYRLTTTDGLTQVYNKRYFLEVLEREMSRSIRYERPMSLILIDLDHFKQINDTYGHLAGDFILKQVAQFIQRQVRRDDILARYGGEEFALVCPEIQREQALVLGEKLRGLVEAQDFRFDGASIPVTLSAGVAALSDHAAHLSGDLERDADAVQPFELIKLADQRLYDAKHQGRNRVVG